MKTQFQHSQRPSRHTRHRTLRPFFGMWLKISFFQIDNFSTQCAVSTLILVPKKGCKIIKLIESSFSICAIKQNLKFQHLFIVINTIHSPKIKVITKIHQELFKYLENHTLSHINEGVRTPKAKSKSDKEAPPCNGISRLQIAHLTSMQPLFEKKSSCVVTQRQL